LQDEEVSKLKETFDKTEESAKFLRDAVKAQAKEVVRQEEQTLRELLLGEAKTYASKENISVEQFRSQVLDIVSKHIKTFVQLRTSKGGAAGLIDLGRDVRDYVKKYRHSNIPPSITPFFALILYSQTFKTLSDVREWFVFFPSQSKFLEKII
jgi:hypothetical protein